MSSNELVPFDATRFLAALDAIVQAPQRGLRPDATTRTAEQQAKREGYAGALPGTQSMEVAIPEGERTYAADLRAVLDGATVVRQEVIYRTGGSEKVTQGQRQVAEGVVQEVETRARYDREGNVTGLVVREGKVKLDKEAVLGAVMAQATHGPWYHGAEVNGSLFRPVKALQEEADRFRVLSAVWDVQGKRVPGNAKVKVGPWVPKSVGWKRALKEYEVNMTELVESGGEENGEDTQMS